MELKSPVNFFGISDDGISGSRRATPFDGKLGLPDLGRGDHRQHGTGTRTGEPRLQHLEHRTSSWPRRSVGLISIVMSRL